MLSPRLNQPTRGGRPRAKSWCWPPGNTSFNIRGEPIVCTPQDAYRCFLGCEMDVLVLENCILYKTEQPQLSAEEKQKYVESFTLD